MKKKLKTFWLKLEFLRASRFFRLFYKHHHKLVWAMTIVSGILAISVTAYFVTKLPVQKIIPEIFAKKNEMVADSFSYSDFDLIIPKIKVFTPVIADVDGYDQKQYRDALKKGVAHFKSTAKPDGGGNVFIFGHSTDWQLVEGNYQAIFKDLPALQKNDDIVLQYKQKKYFYKVIYSKITVYDDMTWIEQNDQNVVTLMTCYPVGSNEKRIIVRGKLYQTSEL